jgi:hypothetical protein
MAKLIPIDEIRKELDAYPFLDAPEGYWNVSKDGYNGYEQILIEDMSEKHKKNSIKMIKEKYIPICNNDEILELLNQKIDELENY